MKGPASNDDQGRAFMFKGNGQFNAWMRMQIYYIYGSQHVGNKKAAAATAALYPITKKLDSDEVSNHHAPIGATQSRQWVDLVTYDGVNVSNFFQNKNCKRKIHWSGAPQ